MADQILFVRSTRCLNCGAIHTTSELFAVDILNSHGRHLFPAPAFNPTLDLEKVAPNPRTTPICHSCVDTSLPPVTDRESYSRWQDTLRRKAAEERQREAAIKAKSTSTRSDNLEDII